MAAPDPSDDDAFESVWSTAQQIPGWLTRDQAYDLWRAARAVPDGGTIVEIGSHRGRSTVVLGTAVAGRASVVAIDPFIEGRLFGGAATRTEFEANLLRHELQDVVRLECRYSTELRPEWHEPVSMLYIDGKHDYWTCRDDLRWSGFLGVGDTTLVHDCYSSIGVTLAVLRGVLPAKELRYEHRAGSLATFTRNRPTARERLRILGELPWWLRNVFIKVLLRLRLGVVARRLGHDGPYDPY